jgi:hypothetical protein
MRILVLSVLILSFSYNSFAQERKSTHLQLIGIVLPTSQVKIIQGQYPKIETSTNSVQSSMGQKVFLTDQDKNIIESNSKFTEEEDGRVKETVLLNYAMANSTNQRPIVFNVVSN